MDSWRVELLWLMDDWTNLLENGGQIDSIYTDLEKAFDKILHKRLLLIIILKLRNDSVQCSFVTYRPIIFKCPQNKSLDDTKPNTNPKTNPNPNPKLTLFSCFMLFSSTVPWSSN